MGGHRGWTFLAAAVVLSAGCASPSPSEVKSYPNTLDKNVQVRSETVAGPAVFRLRTELGIYRVDARCEIEFEGRVDINRPSVAVGLPANRWSYLVFNFSGSGETISRETLFRPREGYRYDVAVTYRKDVYHVAIREIPPRGGAGRDIEFRDIRACRPPWRAVRADQSPAGK